MYKAFIILFVVLVSCNGTHSTKQNKPSKTKRQPQKKVEQKFDPKVKLTITSNSTIKLGEEVSFEYSSKMKLLPDSVVMTVDKQKSKVQLKDDLSFTAKISDAPLGNQNVRFTFYWGDTLSQSKSGRLKILSDVEPKLYGYKVLKTFPHDLRAYTQGLEFDGGTLYEGTGQTGESTLSKLNLDQNKMLHQIALPSNVFGEGITILNDKVYQLTWQAQTGFVYDKETLRKLYEFSYPTEGWGLCNNGKELIMSDGSETIYFLDLEYMQETRRIQVCDNKGTVNRLNELEYIDGLIYANVYGTENIVAFEENTGKVVKQINLKGILNKKEVKTPIDVLNGIAFDKSNNRMIVTGKYWPKLFEVEFVER